MRRVIHHGLSLPSGMLCWARPPERSGRWLGLCLGVLVGAHGASRDTAAPSRAPSEGHNGCSGGSRPSCPVAFLGGPIGIADTSSLSKELIDWEVEHARDVLGLRSSRHSLSVNPEAQQARTVSGERSDPPLRQAVDAGQSQCEEQLLVHRAPVRAAWETCGCVVVHMHFGKDRGPSPLRGIDAQSRGRRDRSTDRLLRR